MPPSRARRCPDRRTSWRLLGAVALCAATVTPSVADARMAFVASGDDTGSVVEINLATGATVHTINAGYSPQAVAITPDGTTAWVVNYGSHAITPITVATGDVGTSV